MDITKGLTTILLGIVVLIFFLASVDIVANEVYEAGGSGNISATNLTASQVNILELIPLIFVVIGIMIVVLMLMKFA